MRRPRPQQADLSREQEIRAARTIVADDPLFGRIALGGTIAARGDVCDVVPRDGVRLRISLRLHDAAVDIELIDARLAAERPVEMATAARTIVFRPERFDPGQVQVTLRSRVADGGWRRHRLSTDGAAAGSPIESRQRSIGLHRPARLQTPPKAGAGGLR